jgi:hypothetical protein
LQARLQIAPLYLFLWERVGIKHGSQRWHLVLIIDPLQFREAHGPFASQFVPAPIACNLEEPALERVIYAQGRQREGQLEKDLLQDITGLIVVTQKAADEGEEGRTIALHERLKRALITRKRLLSQESIRQLWWLSACAFSDRHE